MNIPKLKEVKDGLYELQFKYFEMYSNLYKMRSVISPDLFSMFTKHLKEAYEREYDYLRDGILLDRAQTVWERKEKLARFVPRRKLIFWKNRVAKAIEKNVLAEFDEFIRELESGGRPPEDLPPMPPDMPAGDSAGTALVSTVM